MKLELTPFHLQRDGAPWMPAMGEFHYARHPETEWRTELLRMQAGGIDVVATYVFWIHHEEVAGQWDWSGCRDLRRFVSTAAEVGLLVAVRLGPWCHGEVRHGGLPDWLLASGCEVRSDDPRYLAHARELYARIARQLEGLLWKDGGPVFAVQVENEYPGPAEHLLTLKRLAIQVGLDVPLYTRTGWPRLATPLPFGELTPLFGAYAEGFWDRELVPMPPSYRAGFVFSSVRTESAIANEQLGPRDAVDEADAHRYPFLTCELGGGMMSSYHRRLRVEPADVEAIAVVKLGSGGNLPGYYLYHGGTNPEGRLTTLMEAQDTVFTNWNDFPVKNYDFFAPLGQYNQTRPHYHALRRLHLFTRDFGAELAPLPAVMPPAPAAGLDDPAALRWSARTDGTRGWVFVNNHQRGKVLPPKPGVRLTVPSAGGELTFPSTPVTVPSGARFAWPFGLDLAPGVRLRYATAQLVCRIEVESTITVFFAATPGIPADFCFADGTIHRDVRPGREVAFTVRGLAGDVRLVLLDEPDSLALWKGRWGGRDRIVLTRQDVIFDGDTLRLRDLGLDAAPEVLVYPAPDSTAPLFTAMQPDPSGLDATPSRLALEASLVRRAGPARAIPLGRLCPQPVAAAPTDADFADAAEWRVRLPTALLAPGVEALLRVHYRGDVLRLLAGDRLLNDDFSNGRPCDLGLDRHAAALTAAGGELRLLVLPLRRDAPILLPGDLRPAPGSDPVAELLGLELIRPRHSRLRLG